MNVRYTIRNIRGEYRPMSLFQFFDDGLRKRLPKMVAKDFRDEIIKNIDSNRFGFKLSPRWESYKQRIGADTRPFIMFGHYKNAIEIITEDGHLVVGFRKTTRHPRHNITYGQIALTLEYGDLSKNIPARPLWRYTAREFFRERRMVVAKRIKKSLDG